MSSALSLPKIWLPARSFVSDGNAAKSSTTVSGLTNYLVHRSSDLLSLLAWYQLYRQETYQGSDLPVGKWTKRESKKDWRAEYLQTRRQRYKEESSARSGAYAYSLSRPASRPATRSHSPTPGTGYQTPREIKEEQWKLEEEAMAKPSKLTMREHYKDMGGRKARGKNKLGMQGSMRDRTAYVEDMGWYGE
jgi:hypothetical protein